jgi:glycosyltransferase involved in cell wall biosynthesis
MKIVMAGITQTPFENEFKIHYSVFKTFGAATGFSDLGHEVYLVSRKAEEERDGVIFYPYGKMDKAFFEDVDYFIFGQERGVEKVVARIPELQNIIKKKKQGKRVRTKLVVKTGRVGWLKDTQWGYKDGYKIFDFFFCQEPGFARAGAKELFGDPDNKIFYSRMGVFDSVPSIAHPAPFVKKKYNLLYMGRMRHNPTRLPFIVKMMKKLGEDFHLNILPGTFSKPPQLLSGSKEKNHNKFGPEKEENFQWLVKYFSAAKNITVHRVAPWGEHWNYLHHSDIGIDFSPSEKGKSIAGNAKLLEYMAAGLPSVTESSVGNSELVKKNFGTIVDKVANLNDYCDAIHKVCKLKYNRDLISRTTISENNWKIRAINMLRNMEGKR